MEGFILITIMAILYFLPTFMAYSRGMKKADGVFIINLLLGWTGLIWILCLAWGACGDVKE